ncbi:hypothetical protein [Endozoicomonas acroporae]|uniref:hypothetical protein n=1 Tax=Endozoicomonas acroporae TaxID=1701104 RepID=UPI0013CF5ADD|nr:hypothetical protein [Endozoicomonas acroporae]
MRLPQSVQEIADVVGRENALKLAGRANGCLYVPQPRHMEESHWIAQLIGHEPAVALSEEFSGFILKPATCRFVYTNWRNQSIYEFHRQGLSNAAIAEKFCITERHIRNIISSFPDSQLDFGF